MVTCSDVCSIVSWSSATTYGKPIRKIADFEHLVQNCHASI
jgi:hypothetical protein